MQWTADVTKALGLTKERGDKKALKSLKKKQVITHLTTPSSPDLSKNQLFAGHVNHLVIFLIVYMDLCG